MSREVREARARLRALGRRRKRHSRTGERLAEETAKAIHEECDKVPVTDAAKLAGIHRSTAYEYLKASD